MRHIVVWRRWGANSRADPIQPGCFLLGAGIGVGTGVTAWAELPKQLYCSVPTVVMHLENPLHPVICPMIGDRSQAGIVAPKL